MELLQFIGLNVMILYTNFTQVVNIGLNSVNLTISVTGLQDRVIRARSTFTVLTSHNFLDENSFSHPNKVRRWLIALQKDYFQAHDTVDLVKVNLFNYKF
jgi:hypothetical protein